MTSGPVAALAERRKAGDMRPDAAQEVAARHLQRLHDELGRYQPGGSTGWRARLGLDRPRLEPPRGLYMHGPVGVGKSMLMDLFFVTAPVARKRRVHFHEFLQEVHERGHTLRRGGRGGDPLPAIADAVTQDAWLLCFDEFQVDNITDAMILGRLFEALFARGVVVVATSNVEPRNLYRDGLQRESFLPFIAMIERRCEVVGVDGGTDYRLARLKGHPTYHVPADAAAEAALDHAFAALTDDAPARPAELRLKGRRLAIPRAARGVARFAFADLCDRPLGPADFLAIAKAFHTVIVSGIPRLQPDHRDQARRFVTLIDALYEHRVNLVCSAEAPPHELYPQGRGAFEFQRTVSRLMEMQAEDYIAQPHAG
ncbi:MAG: cell division protein ZapE [Alphaproteobacteria bacterium]